MESKKLFYIKVTFLDDTVIVFHTCASDHASALDLFLDSNIVDSSSIESIIVNRITFILYGNFKKIS